MNRPTKGLFLAECSHAEAKSAVMSWHYSRRMPRSRNHYFGVWENERFVGCVVFGYSACKDLYTPYGLRIEEGRELLRVALTTHATPTSRIVAVAIRLLCKTQPALRLLVSFADSGQGHHGGIYQAGGWLYAGMTDQADEYLVNGTRMHGRALRSTRSTHRLKEMPTRNVFEWAKKVLDPNIQKVTGTSKHRYLMPLDEDMRQQVLPLAKPYPKRATSIDSDAPAPHAGASPTVALFNPKLRKKVA